MSMIQYGIHSKCNGSCQFCLIKDETVLSMNEIYEELRRVKANIHYIATQSKNWTNEYKDGVSLLGGELYFIQDETYKELLLQVIDAIIEEVLLKSPDSHVRYSTVTNGFYDPNWLLYPVVDKIVNAVGINCVDVNFSYDLDFRFKDAQHKQLVTNNINNFHERYNYCVCAQMVLTQNVINRILYDGWRPSKYTQETFPGNQITFLYPHNIHRGNDFKGERNLEGFFFTRSSFIKAMRILKNEEPLVFESFVKSTRNSAVFKPTGLYYKGDSGWDEQEPIYTDGKEVVNNLCPVKHSALYACYTDSDKCMLCDLEAISGT